MHREPTSRERATGGCAQCGFGTCSLMDWALLVPGAQAAVEGISRLRAPRRQPG